MSDATLADQFVDVLRHAGIEHVHGVVDPTLRPIMDAVQWTDGVDWTAVADDRAGVDAAAGEARATGRVAVCAGSYGAGKTHLIHGLQDAHRLGVPVLALAMPMPKPSAPDHPERLFVDHPERLFVECSCYCALPEDPSQVPQLAGIAIQHALVRADVSVLLLNPHNRGRNVTLASVPGPACGRVIRTRPRPTRTHGRPARLTRRPRG
jgi:pyruvate dehydrogenase (quinone)